MSEKLGRRKKPDTRPARARYWQKEMLRKHKVRKLIKHCGMSYEAAVKHWLRVRHTRMP